MTKQFKVQTTVANIFFHNEGEFFDYCDYLRDQEIVFNTYVSDGNGGWKYLYIMDESEAAEEMYG